MASRRARPNRSWLVVAALSLALFLLLAPAAAHAIRYAHPTGVGPEPCAQPAPCDIYTAIESAPAGETVILRSTGAPYSIGADNVMLPANVTVRGEPGEPRPTISSSGASFGSVITTGGNLVEELRITAVDSPALYMQTSGDVGRGLYLEADSPFVTGGYVARVEGTSTLERSRVVAPTTSATQTGVFMANGGLLRDTSVLADGADFGAGVTVGPGTGTIRNATIVASAASSQGVYTSSSYTGQGGSADVTISNSIISGTSFDVFANDEHVSTEDVNYSITRSSFDTVFEEAPEFDVTATPPNQDASVTPALLAHPGTLGDFHQLSGSPTRDAGIADSLTGTADFDGEPRCMGSAPDIGADEFGAASCGASAPPAAQTPVTTPPPCKQGFKLKTIKKKGKKRKRCVRIKKKKGK